MVGYSSLLRGVERWQTTQRKTTAAAIRAGPRIAAMTMIAPSGCRGASATRKAAVAKAQDVPVPGRVVGLRAVVDGARRAARADPSRPGCTTSGAFVPMAPLVFYRRCGAACLTYKPGARWRALPWDSKDVVPAANVAARANGGNWANNLALAARTRGAGPTVQQSTDRGRIQWHSKPFMTCGSTN
jgi:hypothetical protein